MQIYHSSSPVIVAQHWRRGTKHAVKILYRNAYLKRILSATIDLGSSSFITSGMETTSVPFLCLGST